VLLSGFMLATSLLVSELLIDEWDCVKTLRLMCRCLSNVLIDQFGNPLVGFTSFKVITVNVWLSIVFPKCCTLDHVAKLLVSRSWMQFDFAIVSERDVDLARLFLHHLEQKRRLDKLGHLFLFKLDFGHKLLSWIMQQSTNTCCLAIVLFLFLLMCLSVGLISDVTNIWLKRIVCRKNQIWQSLLETVVWLLNQKLHLLNLCFANELR
jgi:hypothetical protein